MPTKSQSWQSRRAVIEEILRTELIRNQLELVARLSERGFSVTQSSVSRDLQRIGALRVGGRYLVPDTLGAEQAPGSALAEVAGYVVSVAAAGTHLLVVKTPPGIAPLVALDLDREGWPEVVGTVAGDDTFFVATAGRLQQARVAARLGALVRSQPHA
jgi:transcriptional regulator of arginine metabolism